MRAAGRVAVRHALLGYRAERGVTLILGLVMLVLISLLVLNAFKLSSSNLRSVGNVQSRDEALAAATQAMESLLGSPAAFATAPATYNYTVNMNADNVRPNSYEVVIKTSPCLRALVASSALPSEIEMGAALLEAGTWNADFDLTATVGNGVSGAAVELHQGVRVLLSQLQKDAACP